jgi:SAM-dependent methyltransferase
MQARSYDFFISYNSADLSHAKKIAMLIKSNGLTCWWQNEDSKQEYAIEIKNAMERSAVFIVLLSPSSAASEWVGREILYAIRKYAEKSIKILPIVVQELSEADYSYFHHLIGMFNWLFLDTFTEQGDLIHAITSQVGIALKSKSENSIYSAAEEIEKERLKKQNRLYNLYAKAPLDTIFSSFVSPVVLDVGSCNAENIMTRLDGRVYSHLVCVDKDTDALNEARKRLKDNTRVSFLEADITKKAFANKLAEHLEALGLSGFDIIHISSVLLHIKNPKELLSTLRSTLNEGGYIFIQEEDDGFNTAHQEDSDELGFFNDCFYIWRHSKESGDRFMGRKIAYLLKKAGYSDIELTSSTITSVDFNGDYKEDLWDMYFNSDYWVVDSPDYFDRDDAFEKCLDYKLRHNKMKSRFMRGRIFLSIGVMFYIAKK